MREARRLPAPMPCTDILLPASAEPCSSFPRPPPRRVDGSRALRLDCTSPVELRLRPPPRPPCMLSALPSKKARELAAALPAAAGACVDVGGDSCVNVLRDTAMATLSLLAADTASKLVSRWWNLRRKKRRDGNRGGCLPPFGGSQVALARD